MFSLIEDIADSIGVGTAIRSPPLKSGTESVCRIFQGKTAMPHFGGVALLYQEMQDTYSVKCYPIFLMKLNACNNLAMIAAD